MINVEATSGGAAQFTRRSSRFTLIGLDQMNDVGEYWCQVRLENNGTILQEISDISILYSEAHYQGLGRCNGPSSIEQRDCIQITDPFVTDRNAQTESVQSAPFPEVSSTPDGMAEELEDSGKNLAALYAVIAVIAVFCIVIVTLTIIIVVLYRKKCGPVRFKTEGEQLCWY